MNGSKWYIPIISHEIDFVARNADEIDDVANGSVPGLDPEICEVTRKLSERVDTEVVELLNHLSDQLSGFTPRSLSPMKWKQKTWEVYSNLVLKGRVLGSIGLNLEYFDRGAPAIVGWAIPRGGVDACRSFAASCPPQYFLADSRRDWFPSRLWDNYTVWFRNEVSPRISRASIEGALQAAYPEFLQSAMPLFSSLASRTRKRVIGRQRV